MAHQSSSLLKYPLPASLKEALIRELQKGERSGFILNFNRDNFLMDLRSKVASKSTVKTSSLVNERKANFTGE